MTDLLSAETGPLTGLPLVHTVSSVIDGLVASADPVDVFVSLADALMIAGLTAVTVDVLDETRLTRIRRPAPDGPRSFTAAEPLAETRRLFDSDTAFTRHGSSVAVPIQADLSSRQTGVGSRRGFLGALVCDFDTDEPGEVAATVLTLLVRQAVTLVNRERQLDQLAGDITNLQQALETNRDIGVAVGILCATTAQTPEQSFETIRRHSQHTNRKLRSLAADIIRTGQLP